MKNEIEEKPAAKPMAEITGLYADAVDALHHCGMKKRLIAVASECAHPELQKNLADNWQAQAKLFIERRLHEMALKMALAVFTVEKSRAAVIEAAIKSPALGNLIATAAVEAATVAIADAMPSLLDQMKKAFDDHIAKDGYTNE